MNDHILPATAVAMPVAIGIDVGGTKIAGGLVGEGGELYRREVVPTPNDSDSGRASVETLRLIDRLQASATADGFNVNRVGVGVPEYVTPDGRISSGLVLASLSELSDATAAGTPILVESDVRCAARAETRLGHGRSFSSFVFVVIGTGISHTLITEGQLWAGHRGEAIALGELPVDPDLAIRRDAPLTVEEQASGRAISLAITASLSGSDKTNGAYDRDIHNDIYDSSQSQTTTGYVSAEFASNNKCVESVEHSSEYVEPVEHNSESAGAAEHRSECFEAAQHNPERIDAVDYNSEYIGIAEKQSEYIRIAEHNFEYAVKINVRAGRIVASALANAVHLLDPAAVIVGGGLGLSAGTFADSLSRHYRELTNIRPAPPPLLRAEVGYQAGVIGAGLFAHQSLRPRRS